ncbi:MAG: hypothetical protein OEX03_04930 [Gammaproteobacteria bacterium]|nr:hypothetical protein [Gammaproteobacteria bacterium]
MKFHQISIGDDFIFNGKNYKKLNNVMAQDLDNQKQVFMKRSEDIAVGEVAVSPSNTKNNPYENILNRALLDFQGACLKQFKSYRDGVSMDMAEAEINSIREEIFQHYRDKS